MSEQTYECEYDYVETIHQLEGYLRHGARFYPIEVAGAAAYWLERAPFGADVSGDHRISLTETIVRLHRWLRDDTPRLPDELSEAALYWLRQAESQ